MPPNTHAILSPSSAERWLHCTRSARLELEFSEKESDAAAFHGTADPWAVTEEIEEACSRLEIPLYLTEGANHSLETGDVQKDIEILAETIRRIAGI